MAAVGEALFYRRGGGVNDDSPADLPFGRRQAHRLQGLPDLSKPGKQPQGSHGRLADLSRVAGRAAHHATSLVGLLSPAALAGS